MAERFLVSVDPQTLDEGLDLQVISYISDLHFVVTPESYEQSLAFVKKYSDHFQIYCDCFALGNVDQIINLLNSGCTKVFLSSPTFQSILGGQLVQGDNLKRLALIFRQSNDKACEEEEVQAAIKAIESHSHDTLGGLGFSGSSNLFRSIQSKIVGQKIENRIYVHFPSGSSDEYIQLAKDGFVAIVPSCSLAIEAREGSNQFSIQRLITDFVRSDRPDGLFPTVVSDERGFCLGLVYSSKESIATAVSTGRGVYYSRSRKGLWKKGEESGNTQELVKISLDCDADTLEFKVRQKGEGDELFPV